METPQAVMQLAKELIDIYECHFLFLGIYENKEVYKFIFPKGERTGFPYIYLYDRSYERAVEVTGNAALKICRIMRK